MALLSVHRSADPDRKIMDTANTKGEEGLVWLQTAVCIQEDIYPSIYFFFLNTLKQPESDTKCCILKLNNKNT